MLLKKMKVKYNKSVEELTASEVAFKTMKYREFAETYASRVRNKIDSCSKNARNTSYDSLETIIAVGAQYTDGFEYSMSSVEGMRGINLKMLNDPIYLRTFLRAELQRLSATLSQRMQHDYGNESWRRVAMESRINQDGRTLSHKNDVAEHYEVLGTQAGIVAGAATMLGLITNNITSAPLSVAGGVAVGAVAFLVPFMYRKHQAAQIAALADKLGQVRKLSDDSVLEFRRRTKIVFDVDANNKLVVRVEYPEIDDCITTCKDKGAAKDLGVSIT